MGLDVLVYSFFSALTMLDLLKKEVAPAKHTQKDQSGKESF